MDAFYKRLRENPMAARVAFREGCFWVDGRRVRGLTRMLDHYFGACACHGLRTAGGGGLTRGERVHAQLAAYVCRREIPTDPWVAKIVRHLRAAGVVPVWAEYHVADSAAGLATAIDLVAWSVPDNAPRFYEIKTGHARNYLTYAGTLAALGPGLRASMYHLHSLQVLATRAIMQRGMGLSFPLPYWRILRVNDTGVFEHETAPRLRGRNAALYSLLSKGRRRPLRTLTRRRRGAFHG